MIKYGIDIKYGDANHKAGINLKTKEDIIAKRGRKFFNAEGTKDPVASN